jgi:two-component sensor histidine kinase
LALVVIIATLLIYAVIAANANTPLPRLDSFVPTVVAITFVADLVVAVLLYAQFWVTGSRALLVLASGYLFSSLILIPHVLTFPGAFAPTGLLWAGPQSAAYLSVSWRFGLSLAFLGYACLMAGKPSKDTPDRLRRPSIVSAVTIISTAVGAVTWVAIAHHELLPSLLVNGRISPWGHMANGCAAVTSALALFLLWKRGRSVLDLWLMVAVFALIAETTSIALFINARFTFGFYGLRLTSLAVSKVVLVGLLWEAMRLQVRLQTVNSRQRLLVEELNHRVKNTLATVQSIASQTFREEPDPKAFHEAFQKRLAALSRTHNRLSEVAWAGLPLRDVLAAEMAPYADGADRVAIDGPDVKLTPSASLAFGMAFHELATNAAKYGAFSVPDGRVRVQWRIDDVSGARHLRMAWRESNGPPVTPPSRRGVGSHLIERGLAHQLDRRNARRLPDRRPPA